MKKFDYDRVVAGLYAAATGEQAWEAALAPVQAAFDARAAVLQSVDLATGRIVQLSLGGPAMHAATLDYLRQWHVQDPRRQHLLGHLPEVLDRWWHCHEHFDAAFAARDPFYRHFLPAHDTRYLSVTMLPVGPGMVSAFALELPQARGPLSAEEQHWLARLGGHVKEAVRQHERVRRLTAQALAGHQLLNVFAYPMWLLDEDRFVLHANPAAQAAATLAERVRAPLGRLQLAAARADRQLGERLKALAALPHGSRALVDARRHTADAVAWLLLQKIDPAPVLGVFGERPLVMATLFAADQMSQLDAFALADVFGLTPAQARVAVLLADGHSAPEIAAQLGTSEATVRSHLRQVMLKLGARRLADAVRVLHQGDALWSRAAPPPV